MRANDDDIMRHVVGEFLGTFLLVLIGVGSVQAAVATGAQSGLWQVAVVWSIGVTLAIYCSASLSQAHLNPAVTVAMLAFRGFSGRLVLPYVLAQLAGAIAAAALLLLVYHEAIAFYEAREGIVRGMPGSEMSAMMFGEYYPNPGVFGVGPDAHRAAGMLTACLAEFVGTGLLVFVIFRLTSPENTKAPSPELIAPAIGLTVGAIISVMAPLSQAGLNPARDFGPRLVSYLAGWGDIAIPGPRNEWLLVYILSPILGALVAGLLAHLLERGARDDEAPTG